MKQKHDQANNKKYVETIEVEIRPSLISHRNSKSAKVKMYPMVHLKLFQGQQICLRYKNLKLKQFLNYWWDIFYLNDFRKY